MLALTPALTQRERERQEQRDKKPSPFGRGQGGTGQGFTGIRPWNASGGEGGTPAIKICGISTPAAYEAAATADYIGFVFFPPSPRFITPTHAATLAIGPALHVGLFVDPTDAQVAEVLDAVDLDVLQLVAPPARVDALRATFGRPVWRAIGIRSQADLPTTMDSDALLLDAKPPPGATRPGGNAARFDWSLLSGWKPPGPWLLAGGLTPGNIAAAIAATDAPAVDVSSGVESAPGIKDPALIEAFLRAARDIG